MFKRDNAVTALVIAAVVAALLGVAYHFLKPRPRVRADGSGLVETVDPTGDRSRRSLIQVVDGVNFDLDSFGLTEKDKELLIASFNHARATEQGVLDFQEQADLYRQDMKRYFDQMSKVRFYEMKGEYKKAIMILVDLSKQEFKSAEFKARIFIRLSELLLIAGDKKQSLKAMMRYFETIEKDDPTAAQSPNHKERKLQVMKELNALGGL